MRRTLLRIGLLAALLVGGAHPAQASAAYVTSAVGSDGASTVTLTFTGGSGHIGVCGIVFSGTTLSSVSDGTNTWTVLALAPTDGNFTLKMAYLESGLLTGSTTVTATFAGAPSGQSIGCAEYSGLATSNSFDTSASNHQAAPGTGGNAVTSGSFTTAANNELVVGYLFARSCSGCAINAGTSPLTLTERQQVDYSFYNPEIEDGAAPTAGSTSVTWTLVSDKETCTAALAFKEPATTSPNRLTLLGVGPGE